MSFLTRSQQTDSQTATRPLTIAETKPAPSPAPGPCPHEYDDYICRHCAQVQPGFSLPIMQMFDWLERHGYRIIGPAPQLGGIYIEPKPTPTTTEGA